MSWGILSSIFRKKQFKEENLENTNLDRLFNLEAFSFLTINELFNLILIFKILLKMS